MAPRFTVKKGSVMAASPLKVKQRSRPLFISALAVFYVLIFRCGALVSRPLVVSSPVRRRYMHGMRLYSQVRPANDKREKLIPEENPKADLEKRSKSGVCYGGVLRGINSLYPPTELEGRKAISRTDGYWPFINSGKDPPKALTYGEFDLMFFAELLDRSLEYCHRGGDAIVFTDIGSGTGRLVLASAALHPRWKLCRGIEILQGIHSAALEALESCRIETVLHDEGGPMDEAVDGSLAVQDEMAAEEDDTSDETEWKPVFSAFPNSNDKWLDQLRQQFDDKDMVAVDAVEVEELNDCKGLQIMQKEAATHDDHSDQFFLPASSKECVEEIGLANVQFVCGSFEDPYEHFGDSDIVFCFSSCMSQDVMERLGKAIGRQCKPGTIVITTDYVLPLEGDIAPVEDDPSMPFGRYKLELVESIDGWVWLTGGQSTAYMHRVVSSLSEEYGSEPRHTPEVPVEVKAWRAVKAIEAGELTDTNMFLRKVRNQMMFHGFPENWLPSIEDDYSSSYSLLIYRTRDGHLHCRREPDESSKRTHDTE